MRMKRLMSPRMMKMMTKVILKMLIYVRRGG